MTTLTPWLNDKQAAWAVQSLGLEIHSGNEQCTGTHSGGYAPEIATRCPAVVSQRE